MFIVKNSVRIVMTDESIYGINHIVKERRYFPTVFCGATTDTGKTQSHIAASLTQALLPEKTGGMLLVLLLVCECVCVVWVHVSLFLCLRIY